jgi:hypothetical protein
MLYRKRHRDRLLSYHNYRSSHQNQSNYNNVNTSSEIKTDSITEQNNTEAITNKPVLEIPGFYFDYEKNRYFPLKNSHMQSFSDYKQNLQASVVKSKQDKHNKEKTKRKNSLEDTKHISLYKLISHLNIFNKTDIMKSNSVNQKLFEYRKANLKLIELKKKAYATHYSLMKFNNNNYICSFNTHENTNNIYIEEIIQEADGTINLTVLRHINVIYGDCTFKSFRVVDNLLILIKGYDLCFIPINGILQLRKSKVFHINFKHHHKLTKYPKSFNWPVVKHMSGEKYLVVFNDSIFIINVDNKSDNKPIENIDNNFYDVNVDIDTYLNTGDISEIQILNSLIIPKKIFTDVLVMNNLLYISDSRADIDIYSNELQHIRTVKRIILNKDNLIVNMLNYNQNILLIFSNSEVLMINPYQGVIQRKIHESWLSSYFRNDPCSFHFENILGFVDQEENYVFYDVDSLRLLNKFEKVISI